MHFSWLIELVNTEQSGPPRYFEGHTEPGWHGVTTININSAMQYSTKAAAERDIAKLHPWPAGMGEWRAVEHGWS